MVERRHHVGPGPSDRDRPCAGLGQQPTRACLPRHVGNVDRIGTDVRSPGRTPYRQGSRDGRYPHTGRRQRSRSIPQRRNLHRHAGLGLLGALGFTVVLFITEIAYTTPALTEHARVGFLTVPVIGTVLAASVFERS
jgi:hypothetical protein